jgi:Resolvase, N terminal domain
MSKITSEHLARAAYIYVRQSTAYQVVNNLESQRRQYGLVERARQLGWDDVQLVDDDLGRSGGGTARPGFEKLLAGSAKAKLAQWYRWKPRALRGTGVIGTPCWNSVVWSAR